MMPSNVISRRTAVVLGEVLNEAFTRLVQLSYEPLRIERRVDGDLIYDFLISRGYDEPFSNYMRSLQGERAIKDAIIRIQTGSLWSKDTPASVDREKLGQQLLVRLARDILRDPKQQRLYYKAEYVQPLLAALKEDGYVFEGGNLLPLPHVAALSDARTVLESVPGPHLHQHVHRLLEALEGDPEQALGSAKELVESVCKTILLARNALPEGTPEIPELISLVRNQLELVPAAADDATKGREIVKRVLGSMGSIIQGLAELRSLYGTGHGREGDSKGLTLRHARLAAGSAATLAAFLWETHQEQGPPPKAST